jgi:hypothetical protein
VGEAGGPTVDAAIAAISEAEWVQEIDRNDC